MDVKFGVTGILFDQKESEFFFLLLHRKLNWRGWEFVKGGIEEGEEAKEAVLREIEEETGLKDVELIKKVAGPVEWRAKDTKYIYNIFLLKADKSHPVKLASDIVEHDGFEWVQEKRVSKMLTHSDNKEVFKIALKWLKENESKGF